MIEAAGPRGRMAGAAVFVLCMAMLLFLRLLPLSGGLVGWPGPDLGLCLTFAWLLRRPDLLAAPVIALVFLFEDAMLLRPIGLWAVIVLLGSEAARLREARWRDQPFMVEWLRVAILIGAMMMCYRVLSLLFLLPVAGLGQVILQFLATLLAYPPVVLAARWLIGLRRSGGGGTEMARHAR